MLADVALLARTAFPVLGTLMMSASNPNVFGSLGLRVATRLPPSEIDALKKLFAGFTASDMATPLRKSWSPDVP